MKKIMFIAIFLCTIDAYAQDHNSLIGRLSFTNSSEITTVELDLVRTGPGSNGAEGNGSYWPADIIFHSEVMSPAQNVLYPTSIKGPTRPTVTLFRQIRFSEEVHSTIHSLSIYVYYFNANSILEQWYISVDTSSGDSSYRVQGIKMN